MSDMFSFDKSEKQVAADALAESTALKNDTLEVTRAVELVKEQDVLEKTQADVEQEAIQNKAKMIIQEIIKQEENSPTMNKMNSELQSLGAKELADITHKTNSRLLRKTLNDMKNANTNQTGEVKNAQAKVAKHLGELRTTVEDLDPSQLASTKRKIMDLLPWNTGKKIRSYFAKYTSADETINKTINALENGKQELHLDNKALDDEQQKLWEAMKSLKTMIHLAHEIDTQLETEINELETTNPDKALALKNETLFTIRQRHQDLITQLSVAMQGYLNFGMIKKNNTELMRGVDRAKNTTVAALRIAVVTSQALSNQELVLKQVTSLNKTTERMIEENAKLLRQNTAKIHQQAASATISPEVLERAFENIYATMDDIKTFRAKALDEMELTIAKLDSINAKAVNTVKNHEYAESIGSSALDAIESGE